MSPSPMLRPRLLPGLPRAWRDPHTLQLGTGPDRAVVVELPDPRVATVLDLLDGDQPERVVLARGTRLGLDADDTQTLLHALHAAGLVVGAHTLLPPALPAEARRRLTGEATALALTGTGTPTPSQVLRRRAAARVVVTGTGRLAAAVAVALAESGVGHVHPDLPGAVTREELPGGPLRSVDVGRPRAGAVAAAVQRAAPGTRTGAVRQGASLVVRSSSAAPPEVLAARHAQRREAHLMVAVREGTVVVGPLVPPTGTPCLACLDLHRRDRDGGWPGASDDQGGLQPCSVAVALAGTAFATSEALTFLDRGTPQTLGASVEISTAGRFRRRSWPPHPRCRCGRRRTR